MESGLSKREEPEKSEAFAECASMTTFHASECALEDWLAFLGHRWNALILWHLTGGPRSFSDMETVLSGISPKVLTERLVALGRQGLVSRSVTATFPRGTRYALTEAGHELAAPLQQLYGWASKHPLQEA